MAANGTSAAPSPPSDLFPTMSPSLGHTESDFKWTPVSIILSVVLFLFAGLAEIGGGWLVWSFVREGKPYWWAIIGSLVLVSYGFIPTLQPTGSFGRIYAVYGGFFIAGSYLFGWVADGTRPDKGDWIGTGIALSGVCVALFWPRKAG